MQPNNLKQKLNKGGSALGPFLKLTDPAVVEICAAAGFDFVIIDTEHGPYSIETVQNFIRAAESKNITSIIRVPENAPHYILRALDIGAQGVQVPQISTKIDAEQAVSAAKFHPHGDRGVCRYVRAGGYSSADRNEHFTSSNEETMVIVHIEGIEGVENLPDILTVERLDVIFLGPYDLSQSCGVPGQVDHPSVVEKMEEAVRISREAGVAVGTFVESPEGAKKWRDIGVQYLSYAVDAGIFYNACAAIVREASE